MNITEIAQELSVSEQFVKATLLSDTKDIEDFKTALESYKVFPSSYAHLEKCLELASNCKDVLAVLKVHEGNSISTYVRKKIAFRYVDLMKDMKELEVFYNEVYVDNDIYDSFFGFFQKMKVVRKVKGIVSDFFLYECPPGFKAFNDKLTGLRQTPIKDKVIFQRHILKQWLKRAVNLDDLLEIHSNLSVVNSVSFRVKIKIICQDMIGDKIKKAKTIKDLNFLRDKYLKCVDSSTMNFAIYTRQVDLIGNKSEAKELFDLTEEYPEIRKKTIEKMTVL